MDTYTILISILIIAIIFFSIPTHCNPDLNGEGFYSNPNYFKHYCSNCGYCGTASDYGECACARGRL